MSTSRPLIGVVADRRRIGHHEFHAVGEKYLHALVRCSAVDAIILPNLAVSDSHAGVLKHLDGLFLTGSPSNVKPERYQGAPSEAGTWHDEGRDAAVFELLPLVLAKGMPLFCVCRGFQELNVALGGTLHQKVQEQSGLFDHREDPNDPLEKQYAAAHPIALTPHGFLATLLNRSRIEVNSLHQQGIDRLADGLEIEARAPDGLIEAVWVKDHPSFALGVQWHPEWRATDNPESAKIFKAFGEAARAYSNRKASHR